MEWSTRRLEGDFQQGLGHYSSRHFRTGTAARFARCRAVTTFSGPERKSAMLPRISKTVVEFLKHEDGPTAVEYAVMLALIIVVCIAAITSLGTNANATFNTVSGAIGSTSS